VAIWDAGLPTEIWLGCSAWEEHAETWIRGIAQPTVLNRGITNHCKSAIKEAVENHCPVTNHFCGISNGSCGEQHVEKRFCWYLCKRFRTVFSVQTV
jgi:hypothetical protein